LGKFIPKINNFGNFGAYKPTFLKPQPGTLKTREWKTGDHEKYGGGKRGTGKRGTKFSRVEKAGPPSMERETDKYRCTVYNWNTVKYNIIRHYNV